MVVETRTEDVDEPSFRHLMEMYADDEYFATQCGDWRDEKNPLRMMYLQEALERLCWQQAAMTQAAPAQQLPHAVTNVGQTQIGNGVNLLPGQIHLKIVFHSFPPRFTRY